MSHCSFPITANTFLRLENSWKQSHGIARRSLIATAAIAALIITPILFMMDGIRWAYRSLRKVPLADFPYFYSTQLFDRYREKLHRFISSEVGKNPELGSLDLVRWILQPVSNRELFHKGVVVRHRDLLNRKKDLDPKSAQFAERFCNWIYMGPNLLGAMSQWIQGNMTENERRNLSIKVNSQFLRSLHGRLVNKSQFQGEVFQDYRPYDPRYLGDTPSRLFKIGNTQIIRTPAVTRDEKRSFFGSLEKAKIVEEFEGFLDHAKRVGKRHFYVNLMMRHGSEKKRIEALEDLERKRGDVLDLLTLSHDCDFYHQSNSFSAMNDAEQFKETFIDRMFSDLEAFHFPIAWDRGDTRNIAMNVIEQVHQTYFASAPTLEKWQRHRFIELVYVGIIETFIREKTPATCNVSCRSCVDRGAANLALLYAKTRPLNTPKSRETLATIALAPALIAQGRPMLHFRVNRLSALDHLIPVS